VNALRGRLVLAACVVLVLLGLTYRLDGYALLDPDEGRNAEVAREMAASSDYLVPHLNSLPYVDKPVLYFAAGALSMEIFGPTAIAARLPSLFFTLGTLALAWWFGRRLFGPQAGIVAALATAASPLTIAFARTVIMDSALTFFTVGALVAFYEAVERRRSEANEGGWWPAIAWGAIALGVLTKGPIALALPLMVAVPYALWRRAGRVLIDPVGPLLFLAIVLPWVRVMSQRIPDYLHYVLMTETFQRLTTPALQRTGPWWYFIPILICGALPWSVVALASLRRPAGDGPPDRRMVFLGLWVLVPLVFFSLSQSKRPQYVLPLVPAVALVAAGRWSERAAKAGAVTLAVAGGAMALLATRFGQLIKGVTPEISAAIPATAWLLAAIALIAAAAVYWFRERREIAWLALCVPSAIPLVSGGLMTEVARARSTETLARAMVPVMVDATEVVGVHAFPPSLPFYIRHTTTVATDNAEELTSNYLVRTARLWTDAPGTPIRGGDWWRDAVIECDRPRIFVVQSSDADKWQFLAEHLPLLAQTPKYTAFGPCGQANLAAR
jgi:4-amino-4-deoxy-L-arabinose transferase-like glycosyltransferase